MTKHSTFIQRLTNLFFKSTSTIFLLQSQFSSVDVILIADFVKFKEISRPGKLICYFQAF